MIYVGNRVRLRHLPRPVRRVLDWALTIALAVGVVLGIKLWVVNPYRIPSASMEPTLHCARPAGGCLANHSDRVLANRFIYHFRRPHRGEIVVFDAPPTACGNGGTFVKRLVGLPGEILRERSGRWFADGIAVEDRSYVGSERRDHGTGLYRVPEGHYFFLGDNRTSSCDSRVWGSVPRSRLIGPVFATYWPLGRISTSTPGPVGAGILAVLAGTGLVAVVAVRRRRSR